MFCHNFQDGAYRLIPVLTGATYPALRSTVILIQDGKRQILVDTGYPTERELLLTNLDKLGVTPEAITHLVLTHYHLDHTGNIVLFDRAKIFIGSEDFATVQEIYKNCNDERKLEETIGESTNLQDKRKIRALKIQLKNNLSTLEFCVRKEKKIKLINDDYPLGEKILIKRTPGHSRGHLSVWVDFGRGRRICVAGDALPMAALLDHNNPAEAGIIVQNSEAFLASKKRILTWADIIYPGHDQPIYL